MDIQELAEKLEKDGLEKGKAQADEIIAAAKKQASEIEGAAGKRQDEIIATAQKQAEKMLESGRQSLSLAARDVLLELQQNIGAILNGFLQRETSAALKKEKIVEKLIASLVQSYGQQADHQVYQVELPDDLGKNLQQWLSEELKVQVKKQKRLEGFRLQLNDGGKIEVTPDSVREALLPFVSGLVKELVAQEDKTK